MSANQKVTQSSNQNRPKANVDDELRRSLGVFLNHVTNAERDVLLNGPSGWIAPDCLGDNWNSDFESAFVRLSPFLTPVHATRFYRVPLTRYLVSFWADSAIEAWMRFLNPSDHCHGEPNILRSDEYLRIKQQALDEVELLVGNSNAVSFSLGAGKKERSASVVEKSVSQSVTRPVSNSNPSNPPMGEIHPRNLYTLKAVKQRLGITDATLRAARRAGLHVNYVHKQGYILGRDWIEYVTNAVPDNRSFSHAVVTDVSTNRKPKV